MAWDIKKILVMITLIVLTGASWWFSHLMQQNEQSVSTPTNVGIDYYIENFNSTAMNQSGKPKYILEGSFMTHYREQKPSRLEQPMLTQFLDNGTRVYTSAKTGWLSNNGQEIIMEEDVKIVRHELNSKSPSEISTDKITIVLDR